MENEMKSLTDLQKLRDEIAERIMEDNHEKRIEKGFFYHKDSHRELLLHEDIGIKKGVKSGWDACQTEMLKREDKLTEIISKMKEYVKGNILSEESIIKLEKVNVETVRMILLHISAASLYQLEEVERMEKELNQNEGDK